MKGRGSEMGKETKKRIIRAVGICKCCFNLSQADLEKYDGLFVAVKKDLVTVVASGETVSEAFNKALKTTNIFELARTNGNNRIVSIVNVVN